MLIDIITYSYIVIDIQGAAKKSSPLIFFAVFLATALNLNAKFYTRV